MVPHDDPLTLVQPDAQRRVVPWLGTLPARLDTHALGLGRVEELGEPLRDLLPRLLRRCRVVLGRVLLSGLLGLCGADAGPREHLEQFGLLICVQSGSCCCCSTAFSGCGRCAGTLLASRCLVLVDRLRRWRQQTLRCRHLPQDLSDLRQTRKNPLAPSLFCASLTGAPSGTSGPLWSCSISMSSSFGGGRGAA